MSGCMQLICAQGLLILHTRPGNGSVGSDATLAASVLALQVYELSTPLHDTRHLEAEVVVHTCEKWLESQQSEKTSFRDRHQDASDLLSLTTGTV